MVDKTILHSTEKVYKPQEYTSPADNKKRWKSTLAQFYAACVECIFSASLGTQFIMPTIVLGALHNKVGDPMALDDEAASWIGSILYICHPVGSIASGYLSERFGRKGGMMVVNIPFIAGWILLYFAHSVRGLYIATLTMGLGIGFCEAPIAAYLGEISEPRLRSVFTNMTGAATMLGVMIEMFLGSTIEWRTAALISAIIPIISFVLFLTIPESPVYLITRGRLRDAQKALGWLRGFLKPQDVQKEFDEMVRYTKMSQALAIGADGTQDEEVPLDSKSKPIEKESKSWFKETWEDFKNPKLYLPLRFVLISFFFGQAATLGPFRSYLVGVLQNFWFPVEVKWILTMTGAVSFAGAMLPMFFIRRTGKRKLALSCMTIAGISILTLGIFASYFSHTEDLVVSWLIIIDLAIVHFVGPIGIMNVCWMLVCEIFPVKARGFATGLSTGWSCLVAFFLTKTYLSTQNLVGLSGMFYIYGTISLLGVIYFYLHMPETEGKTMERIETYFTPNHDRKEKFRMPPRNTSHA